MQSLNSLNDQIANFMVTGPKPLEQEEKTFCLPEKENMQKSMTLMRHLLVDAQVPTTAESIFRGWAPYKCDDFNADLTLERALFWSDSC